MIILGGGGGGGGRELNQDSFGYKGRLVIFLLKFESTRTSAKSTSHTYVYDKRYRFYTYININEDTG